MFEENKEYILKSGLKALYLEDTRMLVLENQIMIPVELYNESGICQYGNGDFDVIL